ISTVTLVGSRRMLSRLTSSGRSWSSSSTRNAPVELIWARNSRESASVRELDDGREVVAHPVVGAGGEDNRLGVRVPADRGEDGLLRNRTVQAVLGVDRGIEINRVAA